MWHRIDRLAQHPGIFTWVFMLFVFVYLIGGVSIWRLYLTNNHSKKLGEKFTCIAWTHNEVAVLYIQVLTFTATSLRFTWFDSHVCSCSHTRHQITVRPIYLSFEVTASEKHSQPRPSHSKIKKQVQAFGRMRNRNCEDVVATNPKRQATTAAGIQSVLHTLCCYIFTQTFMVVLQ